MFCLDCAGGHHRSRQQQRTAVPQGSYFDVQFAVKRKADPNAVEGQFRPIRNDDITAIADCLRGVAGKIALARTPFAFFPDVADRFSTIAFQFTENDA
jgi:hypothetical protein